jgi:hypothetical protein
MVVCSSVPGNIFTSTDYGVSFVSRYSIGYDLIFTRGDGNAATCFRRNPTAGTVVAVGPAIRTNPTVWANGNVTPENVNYVCGHGSNQILYRTDAGCGKVFKSEDSGANWSEIVISGFEKLGPVMCPADGSFFVVAGGEASASHTFQDTGSNLYCKGDLVRYPYIIHAVQFANPATLDPGEIVTLEYLTNSTDLLPTLSPYN